MSTNVGSAVGYLDLDISGFLSGLQSAQSAANSQTKSMATTIGNNMTKVGDKLTSVGTTLTKSVTVPIVGAGAAIVKLSADFESAMSKVSAISGATGSDLEALNAKAQEMGATTKFSATEAAEAFTYMAMAGWKTEAMLQGIDGIMNLAAADGLDLATTSDIVTDALTAFGLSASDSAHFADVLAKASSAANTNVSMLGESFKYVAPVAGALGYTAEDTAVALGLMANSGIKGSQSGTALRAALTRLIDPTKDVAKAMKAYDLSMTKSDGTMRSLGDVMVMLRENMGNLTAAEQAQAAATLFGQEAMSGMLAIINASDEDFANLTEQINNADGAAKQMADTMLNNLSGQLTILKSSLEGLALQFGEIILPYVKRFTEWIQELTLKLQELSPEQKEQVVKWLAIAAAIGPVLVILGKVISAVGTVVKVLAGVSATVAIVVAVIAVLVAAFVNLWKTNEEFRDNITAIWNEIKSTFETLTNGIVEKLNSLGFEFENMGQVLTAIWTGFCDLLAPYFIAVFQYISDALTTATNVILGIVDLFVAVFQGDWQGAWDAVKGIFESVWNGMVAWFQNIGTMLLGILDTICGWFGTTWSATWEAIQAFFVDIWEGIVAWFQGTLTSIANFFIGIWNGVASFFTGVWEGITNVVQVAVMLIASILDAAFQIITLPFRFIWENCKDTITAAWDAITNVVSSALDAISSFVSGVWNSIVAFLQPILDTIKGAVTSAFDSIKNAVTNAFNIVKSTASSVWNSVKSTISSAIESAKSTVSSAVSSIKSSISSGFNTAKSTVSSVFASIRSSISSTMDGAKSIVSSAIDTIKGYFDFSWSLPNLKMPHFSIVGEFSLNPPSVPTLSVSWYKKAMSGGMILNGATIFGVDNNGNLLGGGEAGSEAVVGTSSLMKMISDAVTNAVGPMVNATYQMARASHDLGYIASEAFTRQTQVIDQIVRSKGGSIGGGDTFNFYSPKAIDEIEAAKQLKRTKQELAEGF